MSHLDRNEKVRESQWNMTSVIHLIQLFNKYLWNAYCVSDIPQDTNMNQKDQAGGESRALGAGLGLGPAKDRGLGERGAGETKEQGQKPRREGEGTPFTLHFWVSGCITVILLRGEGEGTVEVGSQETQRGGCRVCLSGLGGGDLIVMG